MEKRIVLITQARMGSTRLPGKVLKSVLGKSLLEIHLERLSRCQTITDFVVATTLSKQDDVIVDVVNHLGYHVFRGSEDDVLDRYYNCALHYNADVVVRVTSDCPLIDSKLVDDIVEFYLSNNYDFVSNTIERTYPDGFDVEIFSARSLELIWKMASNKSDREHVTSFFLKPSSRNMFKLGKQRNSLGKDFSHLRVTLDYEEDYKLIAHLLNSLGDKKSWIDYTRFLLDDKDLVKLNAAHCK
jgi:spore coat polysaccharide biosynthesis protein SpsF